MAKRIQKVALVGKGGAPEAEVIARELADQMNAAGVEVRVEAEVAHRLKQPAASLESLRACDLCVVVGGDGTLIRAARLMGAAEVPIFGVNAGYLGFLTEVPRERARSLLAPVLAGDYQSEARIQLRVRLLRGREMLLEEDVVNDAVINRGAFARMVELKTTIDASEVIRFRADGLIVATPTGSTAYNLAANGPILMPAMEGLVLTPICPHTLTQRPLVVSDRSRMSIEVMEAPGELLLSLDGQTSSPLQTGDRVEIERGKTRTWLVRNPEVDFFGILREKLRWGGTT
jgi:NAD+ kinase